MTAQVAPQNEPSHTRLEDLIEIEDIGLKEFSHEDVARLRRSKRTLNVLYAEDCEYTRMLVSHFLEHAGIEVSTASDGYECIEKVLLAQTFERPFDLVIIDLGLPLLNGMKTCQDLRERGYSGPILAVTAFPMERDFAECKRAGFSYYLPKSTLRERFPKFMEDTISS